MKYIALIYSAENKNPAYGTEDFNQLISEYEKATEVFEEQHIMIGGDALQDVNTATTVKVRNNKVETIDGPFAETKEQLGGYYIFDCENLDEAIKYAAMIPTAKIGRVEVRPIMEFE